MTMTEWLANFYYYARRLAAMRNIGEELWGVARGWCEMLAEVSLHPDAAYLFAMMLGWAAQENEELAAELTPRIEALVASGVMPPRSRAILLVALGTRSGRLSSVESHVWAAQVLADHRDVLQPHERLQMIIGVLNHDYKAHLFQEALHEIDLISPPFPRHIRRNIDVLRRLDAMPDLALALASAPLLRNDIGELVTVLERWYRIDVQDGHLGPENTLVFATFHAAGFIALGPGKQIRSAAATHQRLVRLVTAANHFLSVSTSVTGVDNSILHLPSRFGVPVEESAAEFEAALCEAYCPPDLLSELSTLPDEGFAQLQLGAKPHPVQAVQMEKLGRTWPIVASLQPPLQDRPLRRIVLWSGAGSLSEELEVHSVQSIFQRCGLEVEVHSPDVTTPEEFLTVYQNPLNDLVWVVSHGEYDHWAPKNVTIQIGQSQNFIELNHLLDQEPRQAGRRLLVLNVCDGGRFEEIGALPRIGFAPALAGRHQAVISQMWPVKGLAAAAFGTLLAGRLASGEGYFKAFTGVLETIRCPRDVLAKRICDTLGSWGDLCERIDRSGDDYENFSLSRSAVFYQ